MTHRILRALTALRFHARWWLHVGANETPRMHFCTDRQYAWAAHKIETARIVREMVASDLYKTLNLRKP